MKEQLVTDRDDIEMVLRSNSFRPPDRSGSGSTLELRNAMARFSAPEDHAARRTAVELAIDQVDLTVVDDVIAQFSLSTSDDPATIARCAPVTALATAMGLACIDDVTTVVDDVLTIVDVIGHGRPTSAASDEATDRLRSLATKAGRHDADAAIALLYQCVDATANLILATLDAAMDGGVRRPAVSRTRRVATARTSVGGRSIDTDTVVVLQIGEVGLEFGSGPHACPGRALAEQIASALITT